MSLSISKYAVTLLAIFSTLAGPVAAHATEPAARSAEILTSSERPSEGISQTKFFLWGAAASTAMSGGLGLGVALGSQLGSGLTLAAAVVSAPVLTVVAATALVGVGLYMLFEANKEESATGVNVRRDKPTVSSAGAGDAATPRAGGTRVPGAAGAGVLR